MLKLWNIRTLASPSGMLVVRIRCATYFIKDFPTFIMLDLLTFCVFNLPELSLTKKKKKLKEPKASNLDCLSLSC